MKVVLLPIYLLRSQVTLRFCESDSLRQYRKVLRERKQERRSIFRSRVLSDHLHLAVPYGALVQMMHEPLNGVGTRFIASGNLLKCI
jgi:hypothetical protein